MSQNTDNTQENIDQNNPKSFEVMANALGISLPEFVELERQKEIERREMEERVYPKVWNDSITDCYNSLMHAIKSINKTVSTLIKCDNVLKNNGYPINPQPPSYTQWGLSILEQSLESHRNEKDKIV